MGRKPQIGLLPFYLKLYDDVLPECRAKFGEYLLRITAGLEARGVSVVTAPISRVADEFADAVAQIETAGADCIVSLHLAYSPSLEAIDVCCRTPLPIIILDSTMDADFGLDVSPDRIMYNHGVHGVMDFASMLRRHRRPFDIVAGHDSSPETLDRIVELARAAVAAHAFRSTRVLRVGDAFAGMGDFTVAEDVMAKRLGIEVTQVGLEALDEAIGTVSDADVAAEIARDRQVFDCDLESEVHVRSVRVGLGLRRLVATGDFQGLSVNFQAFDRADRPANTMPFLEISKAMARGIGYAGEGDVLTASLVGVLAQAFGSVTFTEIFCADWTGNCLFLSHMGEISPSVAGGRPRLFEKPFPFGESLNPAVLTCTVRPGPAVFVNLAPGPDDAFSLIVAPVEVLAEAPSMDPAMRDVVRAWIRPQGKVGDFLEAYSRAGGTHHSALVLGDHMEAIAAFGRMAGFDVVALPDANGRMGEQDCIH